MFSCAFPHFAFPLVFSICPFHLRFFALGFCFRVLLYNFALHIFPFQLPDLMSSHFSFAIEKFTKDGDIERAVNWLQNRVSKFLVIVDWGALLCRRQVLTFKPYGISQNIQRSHMYEFLANLFNPPKITWPLFRPAIYRLRAIICEFSLNFSFCLVIRY